MLQQNISLSNHSNYKIGGPARHFFEAKKVEEIIEALEKWRRISRFSVQKKNTGIFILGAGTNILFNDEGYSGFVIKPKINFIKRDAKTNDCFVRIGAGVLVAELVDYLTSNSLSGLEWAGGLPGTLGGAIYGNAGAFGGETKDVVKEVIVLDISGNKPKIVKRVCDNCGFDYRSSIFKKRKGKEIILEAVLSFKKGDRKRMDSEVKEKIDLRKRKQPLEHPNIGSIFKNIPLSNIYTKGSRKYIDGVNKSILNLRGSACPVKIDPFPVVPAAYLISEAGLKGISCGGAMISPKHPNFIVNNLNASSSDVRNLINLAKKKVKNKFKINLEEEIINLA